MSNTARLNMGFIPALVGAAATAYAGKKGGGGTPSGAPSRTGSPSGGGSTVVSPTIQTQVSPQISPVFQQTGSGDQTAGTSMVAPGGQTAQGGGAGPLPRDTPIKADPYRARTPSYSYTSPTGYSPAEQVSAMQGTNKTLLYVAGGLGALALVFALTNKPRKSA